MSQIFKMSIKSVLGNKFRSFLTMLGIIIGVMALVILVSLVKGATGSVTDSISQLGSNLITVSISDDKGSPIKLSTISEWTDKEGIGEIAPYAEESATGKYGSTTGNITVYGTIPAYKNIQDLSLMLGRFIKTTDVENNSNVCVINETAATNLIGYSDCLGEEISINGSKYIVVGVIEEDDTSLTSVFGRDSLVAYIPYTSMVRLSTSVSPNITSFYVSAEEGGTMETAETAMNELLLDRFAEDEDAFTLNSQNALEDTMSSVTSMLQILLGGIAAISLIVGGIGIMNIMLVTVTERTREIGIRKAIGASRGVILAQFLLEAVMLCMMGCLIGIFLSWGILQIITMVVSSLNMTFAMDFSVVMIAVLFCLAIGVLFGLYPANKAAKMKPIDALRYSG